MLQPIRVVITNFPEGKTEELEAVNNPGDETAGKRLVPFSRELFIERDDFAESAAAEIYFPSQTRRRSAFEICLYHQVRRSRERYRRQHHRTTLHRRPRQQDRRRDLRAQG
ncbi:MAG: hypothetical protein WDN00_08255 [Limisphaerales bacterium]